MKNEKKSIHPCKSVASLCCSASERQQGDITRLLNCQAHAALVRCANARQAPGHDLAALRNELRQQPNVLVIDRVDFLDAEFADFLATEKFSSARPAFAASGSRTLWTAFSAVPISAA
jgi:hypothetical protein